MSTDKQLPKDNFPHGRWLLCAPEHFDIKYEINPWMDMKITPASETAAKQWRTLHHTLIRLGAYVEYIQGEDHVPDLVYTANAGLVKGKKFVLSAFTHPQRQEEEPIFEEWFARNGFEVLKVTKGTFEGEGDALFAGETLFCGHGFRSEPAAYDEVKDLLGLQKTVLCELTDSRFYHLDTCFCPIDPDNALVNPRAFTPASLEEMGKNIKLHEVSEGDAANFVCNAVVLGKDVILPAGCDDTYTYLASLGYTAHPVEMNEFMKGGGASKCLSLQLDRD